MKRYFLPSFISIIFLVIFLFTRTHNSGACQGFFLASNDSNIHSEYSSVVAACKINDVAFLNEKFHINENDIELACEHIKRSANENNAVYLLISNKSSKSLSVLDAVAKKLTRNSFRLDNIDQDDYLLSPSFPANNVRTIPPGKTIKIPVNFNEKLSMPHRINISYSVPSWVSIGEDNSQFQQTIVARTVCLFDSP